jgi:hypothetical protein
MRPSICGGSWLPRAVAQGCEPMLPVAVEDLVTGLARVAELATDSVMPRHPAAERQTAGAHPSPNTPSTAATPSPRLTRRAALPIYPVRNVTHVSGGSGDLKRRVRLTRCQSFSRSSAPFATLCNLPRDAARSFGCKFLLEMRTSSHSASEPCPMLPWLGRGLAESGEPAPFMDEERVP